MAEPSDFTLSSDRAQMGTKVYFAIQRTDPRAIQQIRMTVGGILIDEAEVRSSSYAWVIPDCTDQCPNEASALCEVQMKTWLDGVYLGSRLASLVLTLPDPVKLQPLALVLGEKVTLQATPAAKGYTMDYMLQLEGSITPMAEGSRDVTFSFIPSYDLAKKIPTLRKAGAILRTVTWNGTYQVGDTETAVTIEVPENDITRPRIQGLFLEAICDGVPEAFRGLYIRGKTGLHAVAQVRWDYSQKESLTITLGARQLVASKLPLLDRSGIQTVTVTARDRRGYVSTYSRNITVLPYEKPRILPYQGQSQVICQRADSAGQLTPNGTFLAIRAGRQYGHIRRGGKELNHCILRYRIRKSQDPAFGPWVPILEEQSAEIQVSLLLQGLVEDPKASYRVELSALDTMGEEHRLGFSVLTEAVSFALYDGVDGAAFGKFPEEAHVVDLAPHMILRVRGRLEVQGEQWQDLGLSSQVGASAYAVGRQEDTGCFCRLSQGNRVLLSFNCSGTFGVQPLTVNRSPVPAELRPLRKVTALCLREGGMAGISLQKDGWIQVTNVTGPAYTGWIDGYLEYFL